MLPPSWAFQVENFHPPPHEELICSICQCVFCNPVECPCRHVFCGACINTWIRLHRSCPICRKRASAASLQPVNRIITNLILGLSLRCRNVSLGCDTVMTIEAVNGHIKICQFEYEECPNSCGKLVFRKDLVQHNEEDCPLRRIVCNTCSLNIESISTANHDCVQALLQAMKEKDEQIKSLKSKLQNLQNIVDEKKKSLPVDVSEFQIDVFSTCSSESDMSLMYTSRLDSASSPSSISSLNDDSVLSTSDDRGLLGGSNANRNSPTHEPTSEPSNSGAAAAEGIDFGPGTSTGNHHQTNKRLRLESPDHQPTEEPVDDTFVFRPWTSTAEFGRDSNSSSGNPAPVSPLRNTMELDESLNGVMLGSLLELSEGATGGSENAAVPEIPNIFKRTLSLLRLYTHDSDPEWEPYTTRNGNDSDLSSWPSSPSSSSVDSNNSISRDNSPDIVSTRFDEDSRSSYEVQVPTPTYDLLERYCNDSESDPEWTP